MPRKEKLLFVCPCQFGYLTDMYKWCLYLKSEYDITVLCFDVGLKRQVLEGVDVHYVSYSGAVLIRGIRFVLHSLKHILLFDGIIFIEYFKNCEWLKRLLPFKKMILDVRTLSIAGTQYARDRYNAKIEIACNEFDVVSVISNGIKSRLHCHERTFILPLGADIISPSVKTIDELRLLYVGTFDGRQIDKTIKAVSTFHNQYPVVPISYDIIGDGSHNELQQYRTLIKELGICDVVTLYGRVPNNEVKPYFDKANVGVSFVPITDYYNVQPPTKTFEYILSGLYTIATKTTENSAIVNADCGYLIEDTEKDFVNALVYIWNNKALIDSIKIKSALLEYQWGKLVERYMTEILAYYKTVAKNTSTLRTGIVQNTPFIL